MLWKCRAGNALLFSFDNFYWAEIDNAHDNNLLKSHYLSRAANSLFPQAPGSAFSNFLFYLFSSYCLALNGCALWKLSLNTLKRLGGNA